MIPIAWWAVVNAHGKYVSNITEATVVGKYDTITLDWLNKISHFDYIHVGKCLGSKVMSRE